MQTQQDRMLRLATCDLVRTRFAGRAELRRQAERDLNALVDLEEALGLLSAEQLTLARREALVERLIRRYPTEWESIRRLTPGQLQGRALAAGIVSASVALLREERKARADRTGDPLAKRMPGRLVRRATRRALESVLRSAGLRTATHAHHLHVLHVGEGAETARSVSDSIWSSDAGMGASYCRRAYRVATSDHHWAVSPAILRPAVREANRAAPPGVVYLSETVRVRQGRSTSLVTERLAAGSTGRLAWRRS